MASSHKTGLQRDAVGLRFRTPTWAVHVQALFALAYLVILGFALHGPLNALARVLHGQGQVPDHGDAAGLHRGDPGRTAGRLSPRGWIYWSNFGGGFHHAGA
jgi:hypothetical protein